MHVPRLSPFEFSHMKAVLLRSLCVQTQLVS